jgi:membrane protein YqaA with SNARE-associated domain
MNDKYSKRKDMNLFKKIFDWVMLKAHTPYGIHVLFLISFIESVFSVFPLTLLFVALALANTKSSFKFALISTIGATAGAIFGYGIGYFAWIGTDSEFTSFAHFFFNNIPAFSIDAYNNLQNLYHEWGVLIIFAAGFTPMPFELITITSGVFNINFFLFIISVLLGRGARYYLLAFLIWKYGERVKTFIDNHFNKLAFGLTAGVVTIFIAIKFIF